MNIQQSLAPALVTGACRNSALFVRSVCFSLGTVHIVIVVPWLDDTLSSRIDVNELMYAKDGYLCLFNNN